MTNLLTDAIIPVRTGRRPDRVSLPDLYVRLAADEVDAFPGLAAHQSPAWFEFLAQLGALAVRHRGSGVPPADAEAWKTTLAELAANAAPSAWSLVGDELTQPAFLQPPTSRFGDYKRFARTPDGFDVLVTAKNHDRKQAQAVGGDPHLWLYALVNLQTQQGYSGRGQPGVARMNGGFASRVLVDRRPNDRWGARVERAIRMLLARRDDVFRSVDQTVYRTEGGLALTWLRDWDDDRMLSLAELDPYFIEVCRRVRLIRTEAGAVEAWVRPAINARTDAKAFLGNLGDPWIPLDLRKSPPTALTVGPGGFDYRLTQRILFDSGASRKPLAFKALPGESGRNAELHFAALVRGQGKTEGFHERVVPLPAAVALHLERDADEDDETSLQQLSERMVADAGSVRKVLRQAMTVYLQGPDNPNFKRPDAASVVFRFDRRTDEEFFKHLFAAPDAGYSSSELEWQRFLKNTAVELARDAWDRLSPPSVRREKAQYASEVVLFGGLRKQLPDAFPKADPTK